MAVRKITFYPGICGWTLARAHARSGGRIAIAAYLITPSAPSAGTVSSALDTAG